MTNVFFASILGHLAADFILQGDALATKKRGLNKYMLTHVSIAAFMFLLPVWLLTGSLKILSVLVLFIVHLLIDVAKKELDLRFVKGNQGLFYKLLGLDQMLHIASLYFLIEIGMV